MLDLIDFGISSDFISTNKQLAKTRQNSRTGGPYTRRERFERRQEVYRLHFELGYAGSKIAEVMRLNRHTIESDIQYWYGRLANKWEQSDIAGWMQKQVNRLEVQRGRLIEYLNAKDADLEQKLSIERLLLDVDNRLSHMIMNAYYKGKMFEVALYVINHYAERQKLPERWIDTKRITTATPRQYEAIIKILNGNGGKA